MRRHKTAALLAACLFLASSTPANAAVAMEAPQGGDKIQRSSSPSGAPEIHPSLWAGGLILLVGGTLVLLSRRRKQHI